MGFPLTRATTGSVPVAEVLPVRTITIPSPATKSRICLQDLRYRTPAGRAAAGLRAMRNTSPSGGRQAAVQGHDAAGHPGGIIGSKIEREGGNILGRSHPSQGMKTIEFPPAQRTAFRVPARPPHGR